MVSIDVVKFIWRNERIGTLKGAAPRAPPLGSATGSDYRHFQKSTIIYRIASLLYDGRCTLIIFTLSFPAAVKEHKMKESQ